MAKNRKPRSIGRILIDLTPLLDVVFIMLIVVLAGQDNYNSKADQKIAEAEKIVAEAESEVSEIEAKNSALSEQMAAYSEINDHFNIVTVYAAYSTENRKLRTIYLVINTDDPIQINLNPSNTSSAWAECREMIENVIKKDKDLPMILSISTSNDEKMLYRDEQAIITMLNDLGKTYSNITVRYTNP